MKKILAVILVPIFFAGGAAAAIWFGLFDVSARVPHWDITLELIEAVRDRSIIVHSREVKIPASLPLEAKGGQVYHEACRHCHGAPGFPAEAFAQGLYPAPADLLSGSIQKEWENQQLFWIVENGLKMTGMPAFGPSYSTEEILGVVAFLGKLPGMNVEQYHSFLQLPR